MWWLVLYAYINNFLFPSRYINIEISNCIDLISNYLKLKADVWKIGADLNELRSKRLVLQISINDSFKNISQYLEKNKMNTINSKHNRKVVITVSFLHEIINSASSISFKDTEIIERLEHEEILDSLHKILCDFCFILNDISKSIKSNSKYSSHFYLSEELDLLVNKIKAYNLKYSNDKAYTEGFLLYIENQVEKITGLENVFLDGVDLDNLISNINTHKKPIIKSNNYQIKTLIDNLNFKSVFFKYSLRITIAMLFGLVLGNLIQIEKPYWILLSILVIMRPGYGLTKSRAYSRVIGTIIGGVIGVLILSFIKDIYVLTCLAIIVMIFSYWLMSRDYKIGVTFLTLFIILIFGILNNDPALSLVYRIADTILGSLIALIATNYLWPSWEINSIKNNLKLAISSSDEFLHQLDEYYFKKNKNLDDFLLARKNAFINSSNLMASYQRLVQEPKNKQVNRAEFYEITVLNQTLIGAISSLINFLNLNKDFKINKDLAYLIQETRLNLEDSTNFLNKKNVIRTDSLKIDNLVLNIDYENNYLLIHNQIVWIKNISEQIEKVSKEI